MRVAVVTGGARRIGAAIVNSLIDDGWAVIVHCNRSLTQARQLIREVEERSLVVTCQMMMIYSESLRRYTTMIWSPKQEE